jgi:hypothetical protein
LLNGTADLKLLSTSQGQHKHIHTSTPKRNI